MIKFIPDLFGRLLIKKSVWEKTEADTRAEDEISDAKLEQAEIENDSSSLGNEIQSHEKNAASEKMHKGNPTVNAVVRASKRIGTCLIITTPLVGRREGGEVQPTNQPGLQKSEVPLVARRRLVGWIPPTVVSTLFVYANE